MGISVRKDIYINQGTVLFILDTFAYFLNTFRHKLSLWSDNIDVKMKISTSEYKKQISNISCQFIYVIQSNQKNNNLNIQKHTVKPLI